MIHWFISLCPDEGQEGLCITSDQFTRAPDTPWHLMLVTTPMLSLWHNITLAHPGAAHVSRDGGSGARHWRRDNNHPRQEGVTTRYRHMSPDTHVCQIKPVTQTSTFWYSNYFKYLICVINYFKSSGNIFVSFAAWHGHLTRFPFTSCLILNMLRTWHGLTQPRVTRDTRQPSSDVWCDARSVTAPASLIPCLLIF